MCASWILCLDHYLHCWIIGKDKTASSRFLPTGDDEDSVLPSFGRDIGHEVIIVYTSPSLPATSGVFYTDSNGRQFVKRVKGERAEFQYNAEEEEQPVAANYYPITNCEFI